MCKTIYIAGKVTDHSTGQVIPGTEEKFLQAQAALESQGHNVINPFALIQHENQFRIHINQEPLTEWRHIMGICLAEMTQADEVCLLPDWHESRGAKLEREVAIVLGMSVKPYHACL